MADNLTTQSGTLATIPTATVIATDDVGSGVHYQKMKVFDATDNSTVGMIVNGDGSANVRQRPNLSRLSATSAGLTTVTTTYTAGDQLGTILSWANAVTTSGGYSVLRKVTLLDKAKVLGGVDLYLFDQSVTLAADNAAADFSDADMDFCVAIISLPAPSLDASNGIATVTVDEAIKCNVTTLYGALVTRYGNNIFTAVTDINVKLWVEL